MRFKINKERRVPIWCLVVYALTAVVAVCHVAFYFSSGFADAFNMTVGAFFRAVFAKVTGILPFSLAETVIVSLPVVFIVGLILAIRTILRSSPAKSTRMICSMLAALCLLYSGFVTNFASAYRGSGIEDKLGIEDRPVSAEQLKYTAEYFRDKATEEAEKLNYSYSGGAPMPYSLREMTSKLNEAYKAVSERYDFVQSLEAPVKFIALSEPMTYTHISGVYTFFTGEANININFPDYCLPFTAAHEMSHQRGIAPEDDANFMAFLVCDESDDPYIRYSGYMSVYEYLLDALYSANREYYTEVRDMTDTRIKREFVAYNEFFAAYSDNLAATVSGTVNDTYLKLQGQTEGSKSYGMVVDLAVAWVEKNAYNDGN